VKKITLYVALAALLAFSLSLTVGAAEKGTINVWAFIAEEHAGPMIQEAARTFTPKTGLKVKYTALGYTAPFNKILLAAASGDVPDMVFAQPHWPMELYSRGAVVDLKREFGAEYDKLVSTFFPGSLTAYDYVGARFALPHNMWTPVTFYTKDTVDQMGWQIPNTWDDVRALIPKIKGQKMEFIYRPGFVTSATIEFNAAAVFMPFLFQHGGDFFTQDGLKSALDTEEAIAAFREFTELFTKHKVPLEADMNAMLKRGEMPIMVNNDTNTQWMRAVLASAGRGGVLKMAHLPGTMRGGKLDRAGDLYSWSQFIMKGAKNKKETWEYVKWYYSKDANSAILKGWAKLIPGLTWKLAVREVAEEFLRSNFPDEAQVLLDQVSASRYIRPVLGGFSMPRFLTNAFNEVTLKGADPEEALRRAVGEINKEMAKKQKEFTRFVY